MKDDEFTKLFKYMQEKFDRIDEQFEGVMSKQDGEHIYGLLDDIARRLDIEEPERAAHAAQLDRHEESIDKLDHRVSGLEARAA